MEKHEKELELIERYIGNDLSEEEIEAFNKKLDKDERFRAQLEEMRLLIAGVQYSGRNKILQGLKDYDATLSEVEVPRGKVIKLSPRWSIGIAASVLLVIASTLVFYRISTKDNSEQLYLAYFAIYPNIIDPMQRNDISVGLMESTGFQQYDLGNYEEAIKQFNVSLNQGDDEYALFYLAISYMQVGQHNQAIESLEQYLQHYSTLNSQAQWYLSLSYVKSNELEKAKIQLSKLAAGSSSYSEKAKKLLNQLQ